MKTSVFQNEIRIWNLGIRIWKSESECRNQIINRNLEIRISKSESRNQNIEIRISKSEYWNQNLGTRISASELESRNRTRFKFFSRPTRILCKNLRRIAQRHYLAAVHGTAQQYCMHSLVCAK